MGLFISIFLTITTSLLDFIVVKQPHHTSILTSEAWVMELLADHPLCILSQLGVQHHVFEVLITTMCDLGLNNSRDVSLEEQLAIFLYASTTGLSIRFLGEHFQRSNSTISQCVVVTPKSGFGYVT
jgi:hypothetical protein